MASTTEELVDRLQSLLKEHEALVRQRAQLDSAIAQAMAELRPNDAGSWFGSLEHLGISISAEEIDEARREMWGRFYDDEGDDEKNGGGDK